MAATYSKPTVIPRWADTGLRTEPSSGQKDTGWAYQDVMPYNWENWLQGINGDWWKWIDERFDDGTTEDDFKIVQPDAGNDIMLFEINDVTIYEAVTIDVSGSTETHINALTSAGKGTGYGGKFTGGGTNGRGLEVVSSGTGIGAQIISNTYQALELFTTNAPVRGTLLIDEITTAPSSPADGDIWNYNDRLYGQFNSQVTTITPACWANVLANAGSYTLRKDLNCASVACAGGAGVPIIITVSPNVTINDTCVVATVNASAASDYVVIAKATSASAISLYLIVAGAQGDWDSYTVNVSVIAFDNV